MTFAPHLTNAPAMRGPVLIEWEDSRGTHESWADFDDLKAKPCLIQSVGWLVQEEPTFVQIVPHIGHDPDQGCGDMVIPRSAIRTMKDLQHG